MKKLRKYLLICGIFLGTIFVSEKAMAATNSIVQLDAGKSYYYDLDKNGVNEKISYNYSNEKKTGETYKTSYMNIYINDELANKVEGIDGSSKYGTVSKLLITDVNVSDRQMELFVVSANYDKDNWTNFIWRFYYLQYQNNKLVNKQDILELVAQKYDRANLHMITADDVFEQVAKGKLKIEICQYIGSCNGCNIHYYSTIDLVNGTFKNSNKKTFDVVKYEKTSSGKKWKCTTSAIVDKKAVLYKKPKKNAKKIHLNKGDKVTYKKVYVTDSGKVFIYVKTRSGKKGYIWPYKFQRGVYDVMHV